MTRFSGLRVRIMLIVVIATIPTVGLILYEGQIERRQIAADTLRELLQLATLASGMQDRLIDDGHHPLIGLTQFPAVRDRNLDACRTLFGALLKGYDRYSNIGMVDRNGDVLCSGLPMKDPVNIATRPAFRDTIQRREFTIGSYQIGRITKKPILSLNCPVFDVSGQLQRVVFATLDISWLNQFATQIDLPPYSTLTVLDRNGMILIHQPNPEKWIGKSLKETALFKAVLARKGRGNIKATGLDGTPRLYAFSPLRGGSNNADAYVSVGVPTAVAYSKVTDSQSRFLTGLGIVLLMVLGLTWKSVHIFILRPVKNLANATARFAAGDQNVRSGLSYGIGELRELAHAFDQMVDTLQKRKAERDRAEKALRESEYLLRRVLDTNPNIIFVIDENENIILGNQTLAEFYGTTVNELKGITQRELHLRKKMSLDELETWLDPKQARFDNLTYLTIV